MCSTRRTARSRPNCPDWRPPTAPLAARRGGRPFARPRPEAARRGTDRRGPSWRRRWTRRCRPRARCPPWLAGALGEDQPNLAASTPGRPNPTEAFLRLIRRQVLARLAGEARAHAPRSIGMRCLPARTKCADSAEHLERALARIAEPLATLRERLLARLDEEAEDMDTATRNRIEAIGRSLDRRALDSAVGVAGMLRALSEPRPNRATAPITCCSFACSVLTAGTGARCGCRAAPPLARSDDPVRRHPRRAGTRAAGHLGDVARYRGRGPGDRLGGGRGACRRAASAVARDPCRGCQPVRLCQPDPRLHRHRRNGRGHRAACRRLSRIVHRCRRRRARAVHRYPPVAGGARPHRPGAGGSRHPALCAARGRDGKRDPGRHLPHRGGKLPARHRCDARRRRCTRARAAPGGVREGPLGASGYPASRAAHPPVERRSEGATTIASRACACARLSAD